MKLRKIITLGLAILLAMITLVSCNNTDVDTDSTKTSAQYTDEVNNI